MHRLGMCLTFVLALILLEINPASALTITNESSESGTVCCFQSGQTYAQLFTAPLGFLRKFSFKIDSSAPPFEATFGIAKWDAAGGMIDGPSLYSQTVNIARANNQWIGGSNMNVALTSGAIYAAFLLNKSSDASSKAAFGQALDGGLIGDGAIFTNDGLSSTEWYKIYDYNFVYRGKFEVANTPLSDALPLFATALGSLAVAASRRRFRRDYAPG